MKTTDLERLKASAAEASAFLQLLANEKRLLLLCQLMGAEASVSRLAELVDLSQSALSQHLGRLREDGLVKTRREGQTIYYRLADPRVEAVISLLYEQFCNSSIRKVRR